MSGSWDCQGHRVAVCGRPGDMLLSKNPLPPLFSTEEIESARPVATPTRELFSDLEQWNVHNSANREGEEEEGGSEGVFPHLHTLLVVSTERHFEVQQLQKGLLFTFSRLVEEAVRQYGPSALAERLPSPLCAQCVVTDGRRLALMWLQVENLRGMLEEGEGEGGGEGGRGNVVAVERLGLLYEDTDMYRGRKRRCVLGFNETALRTLIATLLMC